MLPLGSGMLRICRDLVLGNGAQRQTDLGGMGVQVAMQPTGTTGRWENHGGAHAPRKRV